jgi:hypothetical protein
VSTLFSAWSSGDSIGFVMFLTLVLLGFKDVLLGVLNQTVQLSLDVLKAQEPREHRVVGTQVEFLSIEIFMEIFWCPHN